LENVNNGLKKLFKIEDLSVLEESINLAFKQTCEHINVEKLLHNHLKIFFKLLKRIFEMCSVFRELNDSVEKDFSLDIDEFKKALDHPYFISHNLGITVENYQQKFNEISGGDGSIDFLEFAK